MDHFPHNYAKTQNNLGNAYGNLADVRDSEDNLKGAIRAYEEALNVLTVDRFPQDYARTQNNMGNAYFESGRRARPREEPHAGHPGL